MYNNFEVRFENNLKKIFYVINKMYTHRVNISTKKYLLNLYLNSHTYE